MTPLFKNINLDHDFDQIIHLGAGRGDNLDYYGANENTRIHLIEANPQHVDSLLAATAVLPNVNVIHAAVAENTGSATFKRYNKDDVSSLRHPTGLLNIFPGLRQIDALNIKTVDPAGLIEQIRLNSDNDNLLIIDIPGEEYGVLKTLQGNDQLDLFNFIQLYCGREPLYEKNLTANEILQWLGDRGFDLLIEDDREDPDRPCWTLVRNVHYSRMVLAESELENINRKYEEQETLARTRLNKINEYARIIEETEKLKNELLARTDYLALELDKQAEQAREKMIKQASEQQSKIDDLLKENNEAARLANSQQEKIENLEKANMELQDSIKILHKQVDEISHSSTVSEQQAKQYALQAEKLASELNEKNAKIELLIRQKEEESKLVKSFQEQVEEISEAKDEVMKLSEDREMQLSKLKKEKGEALKTIKKLQEQIDLLNDERDQLNLRQKLINDELIKAESQIELISDMIIRDKVFDK